MPVHNAQLLKSLWACHDILLHGMNQAGTQYVRAKEFHYICIDSLKECSTEKKVLSLQYFQLIATKISVL